MRGINLKKCLVCADKISAGCFCEKHKNVVSDGIAKAAGKTIDRDRLRLDAEDRLATRNMELARGKP